MTTIRNRKKRPAAYPRREPHEARRGNASTSGGAKPAARVSGGSAPRAAEQDQPQARLTVERWAALVLLAPAFVWAFWPTMQELVWSWSREPDYSHGFLVLPLACVILWLRRDSVPGLAPGFAWPGLALLALSALVRGLAAVFFIGSLDAWAMVLWLAGTIWFLGGARLMLWSSPAVAFLLFAIPLPFKVEHLLSWQLQRVATVISTWALQFLGQPALGEGNTILLGEHRLEVEQACSGMRIFIGIAALAFFYVVVVRRPWWIRALLLLAVLPIALVANSSRIVITGLLYNLVSGEAASRFSHDLAGYVMIPYAALLFALVLWYLDKLFYGVHEAADTVPAG